MKILLNFVSVLIIVCSSLQLTAEDRFIVIADAEVPDLMKTVQSVGAFSEKIVPGSQMLIVGSVIALNFDPSFSPFDMNSKLRVSAYGDTQDKTAVPAFCGVAKYKGKDRPETIKLNKKNKLYVKSFDNQALIASSELLLQNVDMIKNSTDARSDLVVNLFPDRYLQKCPGNIAYLREMLEKEMPDKDPKQTALDNKAIEKLLQQCEKMVVNVNAEESQVNLDLQIQPVKGRELAAFLAALKPGEIPAGDIIKLAKKISGNQSFNVNDGLNGVVSMILGNFFNGGNSRPFDQLCDIKASHDKSTLFLKASISQDALRKALTSAGVIKSQQKKNL